MRGRRPAGVTASQDSGTGAREEARSRTETRPQILRVRWDAVDVYRLKDGKISEEWAGDDLTAILHQVDAYTPPWLS